MNDTYIGCVEASKFIYHDNMKRMVKETGQAEKKKERESERDRKKKQQQIVWLVVVSPVHAR